VSGDVKDIDLGWKEFLLFIDNADADVYIGIHENDGSRTREDEFKSKRPAGSPIPSHFPRIAEYATWNEFGTADGHVPERSFLRSTIDENRDKYFKQLGRFIGQAIDRKSKDVEYPLKMIGTSARRDVMKKIRDLSSPPNAPSTIRQKGSSNPLIDTSTLLGAISFEVRKSNK
jgi:hypothetical protein